MRDIEPESFDEPRAVPLYNPEDDPEPGPDDAAGQAATRWLRLAAVVFVVIALSGPLLLVLSVEFPWAGPVKAVLWLVVIGALIQFARARKRKWAALREKAAAEGAVENGA